MQWFVGNSVGSEDNDSIAVYGWDYSDEELTWPNTDQLFMIHYPENVTLSSTGAARELWPNYMGIHRRLPNLIRNGRPVWRSQHSGGEARGLSCRLFNAAKPNEEGTVTIAMHGRLAMPLCTVLSRVGYQGSSIRKISINIVEI